MAQFIDSDRVNDYSAEQFSAVQPFPWLSFKDLLKPGQFEQLYRDFPSLDVFEFHQDLPRKGGQRPHNRYYLAYEKTIYTKLEHNGKGVIAHSDLAPSWQSFIEELSEGREYRDFVCRMLGIDDVEMRFAWHVGVTNSEVSPHRDANGKLGTHIFYFNTSDDWEEAWGGSTVVLGGKKTSAPNPDFDDFETAHSAPLVDNRSFLFQNTQEAWHGVKALTSPEGRYRRLFNAIFHAKRGGFMNRVSGLFSRS